MGIISGWAGGSTYTASSIILWVVLTMLFLYSPEKASAQDSLHWNSHRKLTWEDFRGVVDSAVDAAAITNSGI